jgi:hypothetical protein
VNIAGLADRWWTLALRGLPHWRSASLNEERTP